MSCCLILQSKNNICIGADTATSIYVEKLRNHFFRSSNDGEKLFEIGKDIVYCSGDMSEVPDVIENMRTIDGYIDVEHISSYLKDKTFRESPISDFPCMTVIICRVVGGVSYVHTLEAENNFNIVTRTVAQDGIQVWVGGIYVEKCLQTAINEIEHLQGNVIKTYINTYKEMACQEIGGNINVYYLDSNGYHKIIDNYDLNDGYEPISSSNNLVHGVIAQAIIGKLIAGDKVIVGNESESVQITGDGITIKNGVIQSANYSKKNKTGSLIDLTDGTFSFAGENLTYDSSTLSVKGDITADNLIATQSGKIANFNISNDKLCTNDVDFDSKDGIYFGNKGLSIGDKFKVGTDGNVVIKGDIQLTEGLWLYHKDTYGMGEGSKFINCFYIDIRSDAPELICNHSITFDRIANFEEPVTMYKSLYYYGSTPITTSDKNLKHDIQELDKAKSAQFIYSLKPSKFKYNNGTSGRFHHGLIAQDVKEALGEEDNAVYVEQKDGTKGLRYEELIADLIATVQTQNKRIEYLEGKMMDLSEGK